MTMPTAINSTGANNANMNRILNAITHLTAEASPDQGRNRHAAPGDGSRRLLLQVAVLS
jgi:hypothetical protein